MQTYLERYGPPAPDRGLPAGCLPLLVAFLLVPGLGIFASGGALRWAGVPLVFAAVVLGLHWLFGQALLIAAWLGGVGRGKRGVLITSDSPHWKQHIEERWLPPLGDRVAVINWSERSHWRETLAVQLWRRFAFAGRRNFNPAVIVLRGLRRPLVFRFYVWFQAAKHGEPEGLALLERQLFDALDVQR